MVGTFLVPLPRPPSAPHHPRDQTVALRDPARQGLRELGAGGPGRPGTRPAGSADRRARRRRGGAVSEAGSGGRRAGGAGAAARRARARRARGAPRRARSPRRGSGAGPHSGRTRAPRTRRLAGATGPRATVAASAPPRARARRAAMASARSSLSSGRVGRAARGTPARVAAGRPDGRLCVWRRGYRLRSASIWR